MSAVEEPKKPVSPRRPSLPEKVKITVWARAAGRCEYAGCNQLLIGDAVSGARHANKAYIGHIVADSADGPRGDPIQPPRLARDPDNLMLVCDVHHRVFDREMVAEHSVEVLRAMKQRHEERVRIVTAIDEDKGSHVIRYAARIGANEAPIAKEAVSLAMLPERYPVDGGWIDLDLATLDLNDDEPEFWATHVKNLRRGFEEKVRGRMERQDIKRLSVFALAPMPLLIELGRQISDIATAEVRQLLRDPKGWKWDQTATPVPISLQRPQSQSPTVALKLEISAAIADERLTTVLGEEISIWSIKAQGPHNDIFRTPQDIATLAKTFRTGLDEIKIVHGEDVLVHVFPAVPVSAAVEIGRSWQPKAHPKLRIYDQNRQRGGFIHALDMDQSI